MRGIVESQLLRADSLIPINSTFTIYYVVDVTCGMSKWSVHRSYVDFKVFILFIYIFIYLFIYLFILFMNLFIFLFIKKNL